VTVRPLGATTPVAGGRDLDLPGSAIRLRGTRWPGTGVPILLLHGLASQRRFWNLVVAQLAGRPMVALDARGHGDSEQADDGYDTATLVADVTSALDALGISRAVVVGHSWGGSLAVELAVRHPERVLALVCIDGGFATPLTRMTRDEAMARLRPPQFAVPPADLVAHLRSGPLGPWWNDDVADAVLPIFAEGPDGLARSRLSVDRHMAIVSSMLDSDPRELLPQVHVPTWLVSADVVPRRLADTDPDTRDWQAAKDAACATAAELLADPRIIRAYGALHDVPLQWPAVIAGVIRGAADEVAHR
jgi:pimeloyl-ACP methyl ester carboxylesterase